MLGSGAASLSSADLSTTMLALGERLLLEGISPGPSSLPLSNRELIDMVYKVPLSSVFNNLRNQGLTPSTSCPKIGEGQFISPCQA